VELEKSKNVLHSDNDFSEANTAFTNSIYRTFSKCQFERKIKIFAEDSKSYYIDFHLMIHHHHWQNSHFLYTAFLKRFCHTCLD
jgi:hypothetical protein